MYFLHISPSSVSFSITIISGQMESSFPLLRLTDMRQCQPFLFLYYYTATRLQYESYDFQRSVVHEPWCPDMRMHHSVCTPDERLKRFCLLCGVADKKRPRRERQREEEQKAKRKIWRKGCNQSVQAHAIPLALDVIIKGQGGDKASVLIQVRGSQSGTPSH